MSIHNASPHMDKLQEAQGRKLSVVRMGWIAAQGSYDDNHIKTPGVFVSEKAETFLFAKQAVSRGKEYVTPFGNEEIKWRGREPLPAERALASDEIVERVGQMLAQYGITI